MRSFLPTKPLKDDLPISNSPNDTASCLRRRLSSLSLKIQPLPTTSSSVRLTWPFRRSRSAPSMGGETEGGPLRKWWDWGVGWLLARNAGDLEMNGEEAALLGRQSRGTWRHVLRRMGAGLRRMVAGEEEQEGAAFGGGKKGFRYNSFDYAKNFDDGAKAGIV